MDPRDKAEQLLKGAFCSTTDETISAAIGYGLLALVDRLDELSCIVAIPVCDDEEEE